MKNSTTKSTVYRNGHNRINYVLAMFIYLLLLISIIPLQVVAMAIDGETVIDVIAPEQSEYSVAIGTDLVDIGLPKELSVSVLIPAAEAGGETGIRTDVASVQWTGYYDKDMSGSYTLNAEFIDNCYFDGLMPAVTVTVTDAPALTLQSGSKDPMLTGTLGNTASKLDGDWAYLEKFEIYDNPATDDVIEGIRDGAGPFDTDAAPTSPTYMYRPCNDENDQNCKVRSFDTVTYQLYYMTATSDEYDAIKEGWMNYEMVLPYDSKLAVWQTYSMAWVGTKVTDQAGLDSIQEQTNGYYLITKVIDGVSCQVLRGKYWLAPNETNPAAIPGEGTLNAVVQVLAMEEKDTIAPSFSGWMEYNTVDGDCTTHDRTEVKTFTARETTVTAQVRIDIEISGKVEDNIRNVNFNIGTATAPNKGYGSLTGRIESYRIGVYLWNGVADSKGRKGLMAPKSGDNITFDLTLDAQITPSNSTSSINLSETAYAPLLWSLGSNDNKMDWRGRTTFIINSVDNKLPANTEYNGSMPPELGEDACYNGGTWSYVVDGSNKNKIHVTVSGMAIDLTNFPHWNMAKDYNYDTSGAIPISTGQLQLLQPVTNTSGTHINEDTTLNGLSIISSGTIRTSVSDDNMYYQYVSKTDDTIHTLYNAAQTVLTDDKSSLDFYTVKSSGQYDSHVIWTNAQTTPYFKWYTFDDSTVRDTTGEKYYLELGGDPTVRNQSIGVFFGSTHGNIIDGDNTMIVAGKSLVKFDITAVTPTGTVSILDEIKEIYTAKVLYATKKDGSAWKNDDEMEKTSMTSLKYYNSLSDIPDGHICIGVLVEYLPRDINKYNNVNKHNQKMYADAGLKVNSGAEEDKLYECTIENYWWNKADFEAAGKNLPSLSQDNVTLPASSYHWQNVSYNKGTINPKTGYLEGVTSGHHSGDVMQVICGYSVITKKVAQTENNQPKAVFYLDSDQRFVDYKLNIETKYVTKGVANVPKDVKTTLTILDAMEDGITYVSNSAYYGGTYTANPIAGKQGTVTDGTPLVLKNKWSENGLTWYEFEIEEVTIGEPLQPIYLTAEIGTKNVAATDVIDGQQITNHALSRLSKEITTTKDDLGFNHSSTVITVSKNTANSRSKSADKTYIEKGDSFNWTINVGNNSGSVMKGTVALDVLPYQTTGCTHGIISTANTSGQPMKSMFRMDT